MRKALQTLPLLLVLSLVLSSCSAPPDQTVTKFLDAMKGQNTEEMAKCVVQEGSTKMSFNIKSQDPQGIQVLNSVLSKLSYTVEKATVDGDTATVPVNLTCMDMVTVVAGVASKTMSLAVASAFGGGQSEAEWQEVVMQMLVNALADPKAPMTTQTITVPMRKTEGKWLIVWNEQTADAFMNAITGNLGKVFGK